MSIFSSFRHYRDLPKLWGPGFLPLAFIGRLPTSMIIIGVLTLVTSVYGVADASITSAVLAIAVGVGQPLMGRWTDAVGQRIPLLVLAPLNALALVVFVYLVSIEVPLWALLVACVWIGTTTVPVGGLMRVRWYPVATSPRTLSTALSYETVADEMNFVLGPAIVGMIAVSLSPAAPLLITAAISATCITGLAVHRSAPQPDRSATGGASVSIRQAVRAALPALAAMICLGSYFGAMQTSTTASAESFGSASQAGLIYASMGLGAALTALSAVAIPDSVPQSVRIGVGGLFLAVILPLAPLTTGPWQLAGVLFLLGLGIGPASVAMFTLAGRLTPKGGDGVVMTAMGAVNVGGVSIGAAAAGQLVDSSLAYGFYVALTSVSVMAVAGFAGLRRERRFGNR